MNSLTNNAPERRLRYQLIDGVQLAYFETNQVRSDKPSLFFVHATGFHGRVWDYLTDAFGSHHCIAFEQRGHGRSEGGPTRHWARFGQDQAAFVNALGLQRAIGIGHSMGAHGLIDAAAASGAFSRLLLLDPTVAAPEAYAADVETVAATGELHPASKRRRTYESAQQMFELLRGKSSFPLFRESIFRDYCNYGLLPGSTPGTQELACSPEVEANVYMSARTNASIYESVRRLTLPVTIIRAKLADPRLGQDFSSSPTWPALAQEFKHGQDIHLTDCSHFIPMQRPELVIDQLQQEIYAWERDYAKTTA